MSEFDYTAPAELFPSHGRSGLRYRRFSKSAEAIRYAVEKLPAAALSVASLEVQDHRYRAAKSGRHEASITRSPAHKRR
jgi:hypothetical protein